MKLVIASDIHGSAYYCKKLIDRFEEEKADRLLLLGDILYHGPRNPLPKDYNPKKVAEMLNGIKDRVLCVRGNCDAEVDQMMLDFPILSDYAVIDTGCGVIFATHGHKYDENNLPPLKKGDIFAFGHIHVPVYREKDGVICINPGSVSLPKENGKNGYMVFCDGEFVWKDVDGNVYKTEKGI